MVLLAVSQVLELRENLEDISVVRSREEVEEHGLIAFRASLWERANEVGARESRKQQRWSSSESVGEVAIYYVVVDLTLQLQMREGTARKDPKSGAKDSKHVTNMAFVERAAKREPRKGVFY